ncbi:MAG TPA: hypothetical protein VH170_06065 [Chthoniobacterales bacterium]|jgi:hypothetical protein|nr:hypothetical protein [Chthoniobacterales bacterium]
MQLADIAFPELLLAGRLLAWWIVIVGLAIELPFVRLITGSPIRRCVLADLAMNAVSALVGFVLISILGLGWELGGSQALGQQRFETVHWGGTFLLTVIVNSIIELSVLRFGFNQKFTWRGFLWLSVANSLSVALALWSLFHDPPKLYNGTPAIK